MAKSWGLRSHILFSEWALVLKAPHTIWVLGPFLGNHYHLDDKTAWANSIAGFTEGLLGFGVTIH